MQMDPEDLKWGSISNYELAVIREALRIAQEDGSIFSAMGEEDDSPKVLKALEKIRARIKQYQIKVL